MADGDGKQKAKTARRAWKVSNVVAIAALASVLLGARARCDVIGHVLVCHYVQADHVRFGWLWFSLPLLPKN